MGLVAPRHVGSSRTRDRTRVPCIGRWTLNHCTTRDVPSFLISPLTLTVGMEVGGEARGGGKPLKGYNLLERNALSNTNVNMIHAIPAARLLLFP